MLVQSGASHVGMIAEVAHSRALTDIDHILQEADGIIFQVTACFLRLSHSRFSGILSSD